MRPYPENSIDRNEKIFNYRISRARSIIENAFGVLVARWRILCNPIQCIPDNAKTILLATIALHNFLILNQKSNENDYCSLTYVDHENDYGEMIPGGWRDETRNEGIFIKAKIGSNNATKAAFKLRDDLMNYFLNEGKIERQNMIQ